MSAVDRSARTAAADALCSGAYDAAGGPDTGVALVAVGGFGRRELAPQSDLDVVLVHDERVALGDLGQQLWYPLWDSGARLDHSVRSVPEMVSAAADDVRVALGLLDVRHLAGDPNLTLRLRTTMLTSWRRGATEQLPALRKLVRARHELVGELAHVSVPDLKEAQGGLRDANVLTALVATWLVDVPHADLDRSRRALLDVRDVLHEVAGRPTDRIAPEVWPELAEPLGLEDAVAVQRHVRELGRRITHLSRLTWRRVDGYLTRPTRVTRGPPSRPARGGARGRGRRWARWCSTSAPGPTPTRCCCSGRPPRPPSATWCSRRRPPRAWPAREPRCRSPGPRRRVGCWSGCWPRGRACCPSGRRSRRPARSTACCRSGSGSGCCPTPRRSTASPSTGTSSRPASRRPR